MTHPFTHEFLRMAPAAEEIQAMRPDDESFGDGDFVLQQGDPTVWAHFVEYSVGGYECWLPLLHQLLGMLGNPWQFLEVAATGTNEYEASVKSRYNMQEDDWHELALAVVMLEKYGKIWKNGKWLERAIPC